ncbi:MAG: prepilin peptidase [Sphingobacteriia bacterium]|nr:prepilin peptidase [Sphingobacteriia bacterium]
MIANLIMGLVFGIWIASYTSSVFYRLPRKIPLNGIHESGFKPFCSTCKHPLKFYEYYSVISWFFCGKTCNYCSEPINPIYRISETIVILSSTLLAYYFGMNEYYFLLFILAILLIITNSIVFSNYKIPGILFFLIISLGGIYTTYITHEIFDWVLEGSIYIFLILLLAKFNFLKLDFESYLLLISAASWFGLRAEIFAINLLISTCLYYLGLKLSKKAFDMKIIKLLISISLFATTIVKSLSV